MARQSSKKYFKSQRWEQKTSLQQEQAEKEKLQFAVGKKCIKIKKY